MPALLGLLDDRIGVLVLVPYQVMASTMGLGMSGFLATNSGGTEIRIPYMTTCIPAQLILTSQQPNQEYLVSGKDRQPARQTFRYSN